jgi:hypothetical protein
MIVISDCRFADNTVDLAIMVGNRDVTVTRNTFRGHDGVIVGDNAMGIVIASNVFETIGREAEMAAFRVIANDATSVDGVRVNGNTITGTNPILVNVTQPVRSLDFTSNTVTTTTPGSRLARILASGVRVVGNRFVVRGSGGINAATPDDWTFFFQNAAHGGNRYVNATSGGRRLFGLLVDTRLTSDDFYEGGFRRGMGGPTGRHSPGPRG